MIDMIKFNHLNTGLIQYYGDLNNGHWTNGEPFEGVSYMSSIQTLSIQTIIYMMTSLCPLLKWWFEL